MKRIISIILAICTLLGCFISVSGAETLDIKVNKAPITVKLGQSIEDVGGFEVEIANLSDYIGNYSFVGTESDSVFKFSGEYGDAPNEIDSDVEILDYYLGGWEPIYSPGKLTVVYEISDSESWEGILTEKLFEVIVEEPIIETNAPQFVAVNSTINFETELTNIAVDNVKVADYGKKTYYTEEWDGEVYEWYDVYAENHPLAYQPIVEIVEGANLVEQSSQDYSNILNTSESLTFKGAGVVKLRVKYNQLNPSDYGACRYLAAKHDDENCVCEWYYSNYDEGIAPCYEEITYNPEKIITIYVDRKSVV